MTKWRYWILLVVIMVAESARQQGIDNFYTASVQDIVLLTVIALNWRRWTGATYAAVLIASTFVALHSALLDIPPQVGAFGARALVYIVATIDILSSADRQLVPSRRAMWVMALFWGASAAYAIYQQTTGFRYHEDFAYYNNAPLSEDDTSLVRIPSFFYNFSTHAKFCLSGLLVLLAMSEKALRLTGSSAGVLGASIVVGMVLSGQRAALTVGGVAVGLFLMRSNTPRKWLYVFVGVLAIVAVGAVFPLYLGRAETAMSFERFDTNFIVGMPNAFRETPLLTGYGMGRMASAAVRFDREFDTNWYIPGGLTYDGGEGIFQFAMSQGGLPWLLVMSLAMLWGLRPAAGRASQYFIIAYTLWGITHDVWGSPQGYVLMLLPMLGVRDLGYASALNPGDASATIPPRVAALPAYRKH